ncbi:hypothetical protein [Phenylobacterium sp.]|uniref:hypothetical protein n=1 Tax=Phenylobacterium sp. TaxID=1871053 RepID=UPI0025DE7681|nr:hypothetical protein [Phenylobacterium sp.]
MNDTLFRGFTQDAARSAKEQYRLLLGVVLIVEAAAGAALLFWPDGVARLLLPDATEGVAGLRIAGLFWLLVTVLLLTGRGEPARAKVPNLLGLVGRTALGVLLVLLAGRLLWVGVVEIVAALGLAQLYFRYFEAEVMSRP